MMGEEKQEEFVNTFLRVKPDNSSLNRCLNIISDCPGVAVLSEKPQTYKFDRIFEEHSCQTTVYSIAVKHLIKNVINGFNSTIFAYGQTGTGKTYTMGTNPQITSSEEIGIIPRTLDEFFQSDSDIELEISISFIEIYNEKVYDLLNSDDIRVPLSVRGFKVHGYTQKKVENVLEAKSLLEVGKANRHTAETKLNNNSSRSHAIFTIYCTAIHKSIKTNAKLNLVDLAGSENSKKSATQGNTFLEAVNINKSLLCIGRVMTALSSNEKHIPYRLSTITSILQDSLNKNNYVTLIACVSPKASDIIDTMQTLEFAQRVKKLKNKPEVNKLIVQYKKENPSLFISKTGITPFKRSFQTPIVTPMMKRKRTDILNSIPEPSNISNQDLDYKSHLSSFSSVANEMSTLSSNTFSPVIKKYMYAMESSILTKLQDVIESTLKKPQRRSSRGKEAPNWDNIKDEVTKLVQTEIRLVNSKPKNTHNFKKKLFRSSPQPESLDNLKDSFKMPLPVNKANKMRTSTAPRRSMRLSSRLEKSQLNSTTLENNKLSPQLSPIQFIRRSLRLSTKLNRPHSRKNSTLNENTKGIMDESISRLEISSKSSSKKPTKKKNKLRKSVLVSHINDVIDILNNGTIKDITKLHGVGPKTATQIQLYRKLHGCFHTVSEIAEIPGWTKNKYEKFLRENFLN